jgi:hypothetical protein
MNRTQTEKLLHAAGAAVVMFALAACGPQDAPDRTGVGQPLPDTFPVTGVGSDLPEGKPLPPEGSPTPVETGTTPAQPF